MVRKLLAASLFAVGCSLTIYAASAAPPTDEAPPPRPVQTGVENKSEAKGKLGGKLGGKLRERLGGKITGERLMKLKEKLGGQLDIETLKSFMKDFDPEVINGLIEKFKKMGADKEQ